MIIFPEKLEKGQAYPLGANWDGLGVNFSIFSANATAIDLCLFDREGRKEVARYALPEMTDAVWHGYLPHASPGLVYGFRAQGPYDPNAGHRFNHTKLLLDPYAKAMVGELRWTDSLFGYRLHSSRADLSMDRRDSAAAMPKAVVVDDHFSWDQDVRPATPIAQTVIYEAHVKGLTKLFDDVQPPQRGTFAALSHPGVIDHLKRLGVTAIELMPVHAILQDRQLLERGLRNYWGYNTLCFFAPEPAYLCEGSAREVREMVRRYHAAGLEVILDVVYNHTCEGNERGPTLCWRGLDNASYYRLAEDPRHTLDETGTGNTLNLAHPRVLQMVMDSLRYWTRSFHVDGFRFDLGVTLGREANGFDPGAGFFDALCQDPELSQLKLIAEPWDLGLGGYNLGRFPAAFSEWNDRFRDGIRRYWRGDPAMRPDVAARMSGSGDIFDTRTRRPWASVNFIAAHDGMTLNDLVSYAGKHNEANGEDNKDGTPEDHSSNWGQDGPTDDEQIKNLRRILVRSMLTSVLTALGTPMLLAGDEYGRTQRGNNNAYCQDNELSWFDWRAARSDEGRALTDFVGRLAMLRKRYGTLRCSQYLGGDEELAPGLTALSWWDERGAQLSPEDWDNADGRVLILRRAAHMEGGAIEITAVMLNADANTLTFNLPGDFRWRLLVNSAEPTAPEADIEASNLVVQGRAAVVIAAEVRTGNNEV